MARKLEAGRPEPVSAPSTRVAYPSETQRGASASGPNGAGDSRSSQRGERLRGRERWTICATSCVVSRVIQSVKSERPASPCGGDVHRTMRGLSRNGIAVPLASASGSAMTTSMRGPGAYPTSPVTPSWIDSIEPAAWRAHGSNAAGKWIR